MSILDAMMTLQSISISHADIDDHFAGSMLGSKFHLTRWQLSIDWMIFDLDLLKGSALQCQCYRYPHPHHLGEIQRVLIQRLF